MEFLQTSLCYLEQDDCYLMLHRVRKKQDLNKDKWIGVGGKFEPGEDALACALREVKEETGYEMKEPAYRGIVDFYCPPWPRGRGCTFLPAAVSAARPTPAMREIWPGCRRRKFRIYPSGPEISCFSGCWPQMRLFFI